MSLLSGTGPSMVIVTYELVFRYIGARNQTKLQGRLAAGHLLKCLFTSGLKTQRQCDGGCRAVVRTPC